MPPADTRPSGDTVTLPLDGPPLDGPLCVAFSGGLDSTVLLHRLAGDAALRARGLRAWHVDHGLQPDADAWQRHCERVCERLGVALRVSRVQVVVAGDGVEAAARRARHAAFGAGLGDGEILAFAHHLDDQAETFLLRALRASGVDGLAAMRAWRPFARGWLWRPLLALPRATLEAYARGHGLEWIEDPSNADSAFDRNFLRHRIMPLLHERWPHASSAFAGAAGLSAQAAALLEEGDAQALAACLTLDPECMSRSRLAALPAPRRARVLRRWIDGLGLPPLPASGLARIESGLLHARADASAAYAWHGAVMHAWRDLLHADHERAALPGDWSADWNGTSPLALPTGGTWSLLGASEFGDACTVRPRHGGERIVLPGRTHSHALKHVLQDHGIPPWTRARMPLLFAADGELLAAGDLAYSARFDAWLRERAARLLWHEHGDRRD